MGIFLSFNIRLGYTHLKNLSKGYFFQVKQWEGFICPNFQTNYSSPFNQSINPRSNFAPFFAPTIAFTGFGSYSSLFHGFPAFRFLLLLLDLFLLCYVL